MVRHFLVALVLVLVAAQTDQDWLDWKKQFSKTYSSANDEAVHRGYWEKAYRDVHTQNALQSGYVAALNDKSDYSPEE